MKNTSMENKNASGGIGSGFFLGLIIGVLLTLLLTTKKGRQILKELIDKAISKISELDDLKAEFYKPGSSSDRGDDYVKSDVQEVKKEIRFLTNDSVKQKDNPGTSTHKHTVEKATPEKTNNKQVKANKRTFFKRKPAKKLS